MSMSKIIVEFYYDLIGVGVIGVVVVVVGCRILVRLLSIIFNIMVKKIFFI